MRRGRVPRMMEARAQMARTAVVMPGTWRGLSSGRELPVWTLLPFWPFFVLFVKHL